MAVDVLREFLQDKSNEKRYRFQETFLEELTVSVAGAVRSRINLERNKRLRSALGAHPHKQLLEELPPALLVEVDAFQDSWELDTLRTRMVSQLEKEGSEQLSPGKFPNVVGAEDEDIAEFERRETLRQEVDQLRRWVEKAEFSPSERIVYEFDLRIGTDFATMAEATKAAARALNDKPETVRVFRKRYRDKLRRVAGL